MEKAYIFLADGFEEIEGLTVVDILRRAGVEIQMVSIMGRKELTGSHGTSERKKCRRETAGCDLCGSECAWRTRSA